MRSGKVVHGVGHRGRHGPGDGSGAWTSRSSGRPRSGRVITVPEIDRVAWVGPAEARRRLNPAQAAFVDRLLQALARGD